MENSALNADLDTLVLDAQSGNQSALNEVLLQLQHKMYSIALRFFSNPHDAEDACQEINIRIVKNIHSFKGESKFTTWVYRLAYNLLISLKNSKKSEGSLTFEQFAEGIYIDINDHDEAEVDQPDYQQLLQEVRVACTLALLQCLDDEARMTYILGEIFEMDHSDGSQVMNISQDNYRKKLSRARSKVNEVTMQHCGLVNESNRCRCRKQVSKSMNMGRLNRNNLVFASDRSHPERFPEVLKMIRDLQESQRTAELLRNVPSEENNEKYINWVHATIASVTHRSSISNEHITA